MSLKSTLLHTAKRTGVFELTSRLTQSRLLILCYHGNALGDEHEFWPSMFHSREQFQSRLDSLRRYGFKTLTLDEALVRLNAGTLRRREFVMTIDDGFYSTYAIAAPMLEAAGFTATIYVTTYYVKHQNPIYRLAINYLFWKTLASDVDVSTWLPGRRHPVPLRTDEGRAAMYEMIAYGETNTDEPGRVGILRELALRLSVDYDELVHSRRLTLMTEAEVADLARRGFDIQLHTHRHRCAPDNIRNEVIDNRNVLEPLVGRRLEHLCYPSGIWSKDLWPVLDEQGVRTATTCSAGLNHASTPLLGLKRILDVGTMPQIAFEAEMSGCLHLLRKATGRVSSYPDTAFP